ncbi:MAG: UDP-4-amino-4-deoxy-L-arabinose--oxoglutarate aminotransferase (EC [uncultured Sulfurovum sp.]|uniref:UDP-4-amino-4-deoxy-L-arabinose--oxoglutarate aminotransferase (EC) n=1 Tax=uncultured Sulfurovum sp. TaxID=269237 RepID=A0A6S6S5Z7_9BACT|nr:MAG: UDP-4-amino-4-deoxy-L-arabinose--oxoglutarate aminotransferase (EC [uncultured Sulfurovum sp.]
MQNTIEFFKPSIQENTKKYIDDVLNFSDNGKVEKLENAVKKFIGCEHALATTSGTAALHLAMCALDFKRGDKVICSINVFPSIPQAVRHFDAEPIFVDIEGENYNIDLVNLEAALKKNKSKKLKAIVLNHMAGNIVDLEAVYEMAKEYNVKVIEDASNALGAKYKGNYIGNTGADITVFSFAPHLCNSTVNGGILICKEASVDERAKLLSFHGMKNRQCDTFGTVNYIYDVVDIGWKYDLSQLEAAYCLAEFEALNKTLRRRKEIAGIYSKELADIKHVSLPKIENDAVLSQYIVEIDKNRDHFVGQLKNEGINISVHYMPLHLTEYYKQKYTMKVFDYSVALGCFQRVMSLPMYASLTNEEIKRVCTAIKKVANAHI